MTVVKTGDRVAYGGGPPGSYAESRLTPASILVPIPDGVPDEIAAAVMLKGMTSQYLIRRTYPVKTGETVLFHAAAGGVGLIACQWLKALGATVIGTVGSDQKAEIARAHGCDHVIVSTREDVAKRVREITGGAGVPVVYDSVGKDTFMASLDCLRPLGMMVSFGNASGKVPPFDIGILAQKGSLYLTRPTLGGLHGHSPRSGGDGQGCIRGDPRGEGESRDSASLPARRGRPGPSRPRGTEDHRLDRHGAVSGQRHFFALAFCRAAASARTDSGSSLNWSRQPVQQTQ